MFNQLLKKPFILSAIVASTLAITNITPVHAAADEKIYTGTFCDAHTTSSATDSYYLQRGAIVNKSSARKLEIQCPVVRDIIKGSLKTTRIYVYNGSNDYTYCSIVASKPGRNQGGYSTGKLARGKGFHTIVLDPISDYNYSHYYIRCELARSGGTFDTTSKLISYRVREE